MPLPNPGLSFSPFAILTAEEMNDLVENIESLADGTGFDSGAIPTAALANNSVTAAKLATNAITLGYAQITTSFGTSSTSYVLVTGLTASVTIPSGGRRVKITVWCANINVTSGTNVYPSLSIWDGTVGSGTQLTEGSHYQAGANQWHGPLTFIAVHTPSAGAKTYNVGVRTNTGGMSVSAGATFPAFILVEAI